MTYNIVYNIIWVKVFTDSITKRGIKPKDYVWQYQNLS